jgi:2-haloacid dehalogenase
VFKPDARVYALVPARLGVPAEETLFVSSNGWDAAGAALFGFRTVWVNRTGAPPDRLPAAPDIVLTDLAALPAIL